MSTRLIAWTRPTKSSFFEIGCFSAITVPTGIAGGLCCAYEGTASADINAVAQPAQIVMPMLASSSPVPAHLHLAGVPRSHVDHGQIGARAVAIWQPTRIRVNREFA